MTPCVRPMKSSPRARTVVRGLVLTALVSVLALGGARSAPAAPVNHGIAFTKGCMSPTPVGQPYTCTYSIRNNVDEAQDTLTITG